jgi:hypothetical protein
MRVRHRYLRTQRPPGGVETDDLTTSGSATSRQAGRLRVGPRRDSSPSWAPAVNGHVNVSWSRAVTSGKGGRPSDIRRLGRPPTILLLRRTSTPGEKAKCAVPMYRSLFRELPPCPAGAPLHGLGRSLSDQGQLLPKSSRSTTSLPSPEEPVGGDRGNDTVSPVPSATPGRLLADLEGSVQGIVDKSRPRRC